METLAAVLDESQDAFRQLRTFPLGVAYLREQWSILLEGLSLGVPPFHGRPARPPLFDERRFAPICRSMRRAIALMNRVATECHMARIFISLWEHIIRLLKYRKSSHPFPIYMEDSAPMCLALLTARAFRLTHDLRLASPGPAAWCRGTVASCPDHFALAPSARQDMQLLRAQRIHEQHTFRVNGAPEVPQAGRGLTRAGWRSRSSTERGRFPR